MIGAIFTALCCLGVPALLSILSALGLAFLINDAILLPLLIVFLVVTDMGLWFGKRHHDRSLALVLGIISSAVIVIFIMVAFNAVLVGVGIAGLIAASLLNIWLGMRAAGLR